MDPEMKKLLLAAWADLRAPLYGPDAPPVEGLTAPQTEQAAVPDDSADARLDRIETRLAQIERQLGLSNEGVDVVLPLRAFRRRLGDVEGRLTRIEQHVGLPVDK